MDDTATRLKRLERRTRVLIGAIAVLMVVALAQFAGWVPRLRATEVRAEKLVFAEEVGAHRFVEIDSRGVRVTDTDVGSEVWLMAPTSGGSAPFIEIKSRGGATMIGAANLTLESKDGGVIEARADGKRPILTILGGKDGQADVGPGYASVSGGGGAATLDGRSGSLGLRVVDEHGVVRSK